MAFRSFSGNIIWIVGASSGVGEQIVYLLAKELNIRLILSARNKEALQKIATRINIHQNCLVLPLDISQQEDITSAFSQVIHQFGEKPFLDGIIFCNGVSQRSDFEHITWETFDKIMRTNFAGTVFMTHTILKLIKKGGFITVMSSVQGKFGLPYRTAYSASKHALHGFFDSLRAELAPYAIQVTLICSGYIRTDFAKHALNADGTPYAQSDNNQEKGILPQQAAVKIIRSIQNQKNEVVFGGYKELLAYWLSRLMPNLLKKIVALK